MSKRNLLEIGNVNNAIEILKSFLSSEAIEVLKKEKNKHCRELITLGDTHLLAAETQDKKKHWRQIVSRCYYSCYAYSRSVRLFHDGRFSTEPSDHKKVGQGLPDDFPDKTVWADFLNNLRADRDYCDYDHKFRVSELNNNLDDSMKRAKDFRIAVIDYLRKKGVRR